MNPVPTPPTLVGRTLGGFLIQSKLGSGGMGVVYRAHDARLKRTVAIKVLHSKVISDSSVRERFIREGRTAALIDHPNVVRVLGAGEEDGIPYLVMEHIEGGSLDKLLEGKETLSLARCLRIGKQLAEALASAHRVGVMHRDVKPANVLFTNDGEPKLADFGLAREEAGDDGLSETGILLGTPHFMSPEACEGRHGDARSDIYSLGIVLYAMLEKRLPFLGDSQARILISQIQDPVPPLTQAPQALQKVVYKALEKNPAHRWSSASEFAAALERVLEEIYLPGSQGAAGAAPVPGPGSSPIPAAPSETVKYGGLGVARAERSLSLAGRRRRRALLGVGSVALLIAAVFLIPPFRRRKNSLPPPSSPVETAASPPVVVAAIVPPADPVAPTPTALTLTFSPPPVIPPATEDWEAEFGRIAKETEALEAAGEYRRAFGAWAEFQPPTAKAREAQERSRSELLARSAARVRLEVLLKPRGKRAAAELRALAARIPEAESAPLLAAALEADKGWSPVDGLDGLRSGFANHDPASLQAMIDAAGAGESADDRARIESAQVAVRRFGKMIDRAFAWYRTHKGEALDFQRTDGPVAHGILRAVDEAVRRVYVETPSSLVNLSAADLASRELAARALEENPADDILLAALDLLLLAGEPREAWPIALRVRRRGLTIEPDREALLESQIPPEDFSAARAALLNLDSLRAEPARLRAAACDWLRKYRFLPLGLAASIVREALCRGGGSVSAEDLELYCAAHVKGSAMSYSLDYDSPEALLADFESPWRLLVEPGEAAALRPAATPVVQLLKGLAWKEGVIEMQLRTASSFAVLVGWRGPGEFFKIVVSPTGDGRISVSLPLRGLNFDTASRADGWIDLRVAWAAGKIGIRANGTTGECPLPRDWAGEIGFAPEGSWSWRSLRVYGQAEFEPGEVPVVAPGVRRAIKSSWGSWALPLSTRNELSIASQEAWVWAEAGSWEAGNSYRVTFGVTAPLGAAVRLEFGAGDGRRRVVLGAAEGSGFIVGKDLVQSGPAPAIPAGREVAVDVLVHRGSIQLLLDGKRVWDGHLAASNKGGLAVGASRGLVTFKDLKVWELEP